MLLRLLLLLATSSVVYCNTIPDHLIVNSTSNVHVEMTRPLYIKSITFSDPDARLSIYAGSVSIMSQDTLLRTYTSANAASSLPQQFIAPSISMKLTRGSAVVESTRNVSLCSWNIARIGRSGFLTTPDYPFMANGSKIPTVNFIAPAGTSNIQYDFTLVAGTSGVYQGSIVYNGIETYFNNVLTDKSPGHELRLIGSNASVLYKNSKQNNGILVEFTMRDYEAIRQSTVKPTKGSVGLSVALGTVLLPVFLRNQIFI